MRTNRQLIYADTGEITYEKDVFYYHADVKADNNAKKQEFLINKKKKDDLTEYIDLNLGEFFFSNYTKLFNEIGNDAALAFRFTYLCTYADYDCVLRFGGEVNGVHHDLMNEKDFGEVFGLSRNMAINIKDTLYKHNLVSNKDGKLIVNKKYIVRGNIKLTYDSQCTRIFSNGIREIYKCMTPREHKKIGLLLLLLPYVNKKHNVICNNTLEQNANCINPMNIKEIGTICGVDRSNSSRLHKDLLSIDICNENVFIGVMNGNDIYYYINPRLYYAGNNIEDLKGLQNIFHINRKHIDKK